MPGKTKFRVIRSEEFGYFFAVADQVALAMTGIELVGGLGRNELHGRALDRLGDGFRITEVILLSFRNKPSKSPPSCSGGSHSPGISYSVRPQCVGKNSRMPHSCDLAHT
jgi:hypothetical protein